MTDTRIALDYLQDLFEKLSAGRQDPTRVDWPFAAECWRAVCGEIDRLQSELAIANKDFAEMSRTYVETREERDQATEHPQPVPQWLLDQCGVRLKPCPFCGADAVQLVSFAASSAELDMRYFVQCEKCLSRGPITLYSQEAVAGWNRVRKELEGEHGDAG